jgi:lipoprotein-releasing system permease protein
LGASWKDIQKVFLFNGWINTVIGAAFGIGLGLIICFLQIKFGFVRLEGSGTFIIDAYPVKILLSDIVLIFLTVIVIGFLTSWVPVRMISKKYFGQ